MAYRNLIDMHIHSDNSKDAHHSVTLICEKAVNKGIGTIAITDHCECIDYKALHYDVVCRQAAFEAKKAKVVFSGQINVMAGIELGSPLRDLDSVDDVLKSDFDFVLASVHRIKGKKNSMGRLDYKREGNRPELLMKHYLDEVLETVKWNGFDSLAHLTYPIRYFPAELLESFDFNQFKPEFQEIVGLLAVNGKALEINTWGEHPEQTEYLEQCDREVLRMFKAAGGKHITVGSDAHHAENVGFNIEKVYDMLLEEGFDSITLYEKRVPISVKIEKE